MAGSGGTILSLIDFSIPHVVDVSKGSTIIYATFIVSESGVAPRSSLVATVKFFNSINTNIADNEGHPPTSISFSATVTQSINGYLVISVPTPFYYFGQTSPNTITQISISDGVNTVSQSVLPGGFYNVVDHKISGTSGADILTGDGKGDGFLGGPGADILTGNGGSNVFRYVGEMDPTRSAFDTITDFKSGIDKIDLRGAYHEDGSLTLDVSTPGVTRIFYNGSGISRRRDPGRRDRGPGSGGAQRHHLQHHANAQYLQAAGQLDDARL